ncbi:hypothetical protein ZWY2020_058593 [Hordeum vulgare]|nr:hypothetical protein ZWY2020_058593 [Hordeum vulgare]
MPSPGPERLPPTGPPIEGLATTVGDPPGLSSPSPPTSPPPPLAPRLLGSLAPKSPLPIPGLQESGGLSFSDSCYCQFGMGGCVGKGRGIVEEKLDFKGGNVHVITTKEDWDQKIEEANKDGKIVVANFSASWCGPCRVIAPVYAEMSKTYPQLMFLTIDVDDLMDFSSTWDIRATPTFFFLKNGQQIDKLVGANKPELEKKVQALGDGS